MGHKREGTLGNYRTSRGYENLEHRIFDGVGEYGIPALKATQFNGECEFVGFNYHNEQDGPKGATNLTPKEKRMVAWIQKMWYDYIGK